MLKKIAAALVAATMVTAPLLAVGTAEAASKATTESAAPAKPAVTVVKHHRKHVRHVRHARTKHVRQGKVMSAKPSTARHHVKFGKKPNKQITRQAPKTHKAPTA
jgi:hypothetical protein